MEINSKERKTELGRNFSGGQGPGSGREDVPTRSRAGIVLSLHHQGVKKLELGQRPHRGNSVYRSPETVAERSEHLGAVKDTWHIMHVLTACANVVSHEDSQVPI